MTLTMAPDSKVATLTQSAVHGWVERYLLAWRSNERAHIRALFAAEAEYHDDFHDAHWVGRERILAGWLGRRDWQQGGWTFTWDVLSVSDNYAVIAGVANYRQHGSFGNIWTVHFDRSGRCHRMHIVSEPVSAHPRSES